PYVRIGNPPSRARRWARVSAPRMSASLCASMETTRPGASAASTGYRVATTVGPDKWNTVASESARCPDAFTGKVNVAAMNPAQTAIADRPRGICKRIKKPNLIHEAGQARGDQGVEHDLRPPQDPEVSAKRRWQVSWLTDDSSATLVPYLPTG